MAAALWQWLLPIEKIKGRLPCSAMGRGTGMIIILCKSMYVSQMWSLKEHPHSALCSRGQTRKLRSKVVTRHNKTAKAQKLIEVAPNRTICQGHRTPHAGAESYDMHEKVMIMSHAQNKLMGRKCHRVQTRGGGAELQCRKMKDKSRHLCS